MIRALVRWIVGLARALADIGRSARALDQASGALGDVDDQLAEAEAQLAKADEESGLIECVGVWVPEMTTLDDVRIECLPIPLDVVWSYAPAIKAQRFKRAWSYFKAKQHTPGNIVVMWKGRTYIVGAGGEHLRAHKPAAKRARMRFPGGVIVTQPPPRLSAFEV